MAEKSLAIVGGGASCVLLLAALARIPAARGMKIDIYERDMARLGRGIAYSTQHDVHLLNVRAANMSAFEDDKDDFARWAAERGYRPHDFVPRQSYGDYLGAKLEEARKILALDFIGADVAAVRKTGASEYQVHSKDGDRHYPCVVQATGNVRPLTPKTESGVAGYFEDPWKIDYKKLAPLEHIALIGSGLTAMDAVLALCANDFSGRISIVSRHALRPAPHAEPASWPPFFEEGDHAKSQYGLFMAIRDQVRRAADQDIPWQAVIDSLRIHTNKIWQAMPEPARGKFMKRFFTIWNIHRHRMAPQIDEAVSTLEKNGRVEFIAASVESIKAGPVVKTADGEIEADAVINCLGYRYHEEGRVFDVAEKIGPPRFGELFETTAIPEIRAQAAEIAARIVKSA